MKDLLLIVHVLVAIGIVGLVLIQQGKGADMGAAFGSGASQTLFGARGSATFLSRMTAVLATIFFLTSLVLTVVYTHEVRTKSVTQEVPANSVPTVPAAPSAPSPVVPASPNGVPAVPK
ncbi:MAG: preprotein translocase subunit SecG [Acidiferrobacterales bacterium]